MPRRQWAVREECGRKRRDGGDGGGDVGLHGACEGFESGVVTGFCWCRCWCSDGSRSREVGVLVVVAVIVVVQGHGRGGCRGGGGDQYERLVKWINMAVAVAMRVHIIDIWREGTKICQYKIWQRKKKEEENRESGRGDFENEKVNRESMNEEAFEARKRILGLNVSRTCLIHE